jgi:antitoxin VapB
MGAQLNIKSEEAYELASRLSELTGDSLTTVVTKALQAELERAQRRQGRDARLARIMALAKEISDHMPPDVTSDHSWLHDEESGLPK